MSDARERMEKAKEAYAEVVKDNEQLRTTVSFLREAAARLEPLAQYYFEEWLEDLTELEETEYENEIMNEDAIYTEIADQYELMKQILLIAAKYINDERSY